MSVRAAADRTYEDLSKALADGKLPPNAADTAEKLLDRLYQPVRVSVMGMPGSGKSTLINLLLNKIVIPEGTRLPTTQFVRGDTPLAICTLPDGSSKTVDAADPHAIAAHDPMFVEVQMPLPALGRISVLEVVAPKNPKEQQRAMHWAAKRTDMAIWCTRTFESIEQALWNSLPEKVKDHAFMMVTRADQLQQSGLLDQTLDEIRFASSHQFNKIMPIATTDAIAARRADGSVDKPLMQKSGGLTLISSILRQVDMGLQATVDQVELILHTYRDAEPNPEFARVVEKSATPKVVTRPVINTPVEDAEPAADAAAKPVVEVTTSKPIATGTSSPIVVDAPSDDAEEAPDAFIMRTRPLSPAEEPAAEKPASAPAPVNPVRPVSVRPKSVRPMSIRPVSVRPTSMRPVSTPATGQDDAPRKPRVGFMPKAKATTIPRAKPETCDAYGKAIAYLTEQGRALTQKLSDEKEMSSDDLMTASADNITWLNDYLEDVKVSDDPVLEKTRTRALDASELIQLMQFEKNENAGLEALSLVIQLKRDLEAEIAFSRHSAHVQAA